MRAAAGVGVDGGGGGTTTTSCPPSSSSGREGGGERDGERVDSLERVAVEVEEREEPSEGAGEREGDFSRSEGWRNGLLRGEARLMDGGGLDEEERLMGLVGEEEEEEVEADRLRGEGRTTGG